AKSKGGPVQTPIAGVTRTSHSDRQAHSNCRPFPWLAVCLDVPAMELRDVFDDREAETGAANAFGGARFVNAIKALEDARQIFFANADTVVAHAQHDLIIALPSHQPDLAMRTRMFHGVIEQIVECLLQPRPVGANRRHVRRKIDNYVELFGCEFRFPIANDFSEEARQIDGAQL